MMPRLPIAKAHTVQCKAEIDGQPTECSIIEAVEQRGQRHPRQRGIAPRVTIPKSAAPTATQTKRKCLCHGSQPLPVCAQGDADALALAMAESRQLVDLARHALSWRFFGEGGGELAVDDS